MAATGWRRMAAWGLAACLAGAGAARAEESGPELARVRAALAGLTYRPSDTSVRLGDASRDHWRPAAIPAEARRRLGLLSLAMIRDGGYQVGLSETILHDGDPQRRRDELPLRQLDRLRRDESLPRSPLPPSPAPWSAPDVQADRGEVAAMKAAPAGFGAAAGADMEAPLPGTLVYLVPLAAAYAAFPDDGLVAATHLAEWVDDDRRAAACARVAFSLLSDLFAGRGADRDVLLRRAARAAGDADVTQAVLAARVKDWKQLRDESTALGRLERCVSAWYRAKESHALLEEAGQRLAGWETRGFAAALAGAGYGTDGFPPSAVTALLQNRPLDELAFQLCELGGGGAVLAVTLPADRATAYNR